MFISTALGATGMLYLYHTWSIPTNQDAAYISRICMPNRHIRIMVSTCIIIILLVCIECSVIKLHIHVVLWMKMISPLCSPSITRYIIYILYDNTIANKHNSTQPQKDYVAYTATMQRESKLA